MLSGGGGEKRSWVLITKVFTTATLPRGSRQQADKGHTLGNDPANMSEYGGDAPPGEGDSQPRPGGDDAPPGEGGEPPQMPPNSQAGGDEWGPPEGAGEDNGPPGGPAGRGGWGPPRGGFGPPRGGFGPPRGFGPPHGPPGGFGLQEVDL